MNYYDSEEEKSSSEDALSRVGKGAYRTARRSTKNSGHGSASDSKEFQKKKLNRKYAAAKRAQDVKNSAERSTFKKLEEGMEKAMHSAASTMAGILRSLATGNGPVLKFLLAFFALMMVFMVLVQSCSTIAISTFGGTMSTIWPADEAEIEKANTYYWELESNLNKQIADLRAHESDTVHYSFELDTVGHEPNVLISYLCAKYGAFSFNDIKEDLDQIFRIHYTLTEQGHEETVTSTVTDENGQRVQVQTTVKNIKVKLAARDLHELCLEHLNADQQSSFEIYLSQEENTVGGMLPDLPADTSQKAALLLAEAVKHLGTPYVWGGYRPGAFDCSGYVSYCLTHSGVRDTGHRTANGLLDISTRISKSQLLPGDLVFFQKTYDTAGASHVGIYVGAGQYGTATFIHCGDPCQYGNLNSSYWKQHWLTGGRILQ